MPHLISSQRFEIQALERADHIQKEIALIVGCSQSAVSRELSRNCSKQRQVYNANSAQKKAQERRSKAYLNRFCWFNNPILLDHVLSELKDGKSPEQIAGRMKDDGRIHRISHQTIYNYIQEDKEQGGSLFKLLRYQGRKYKWIGLGGHDRGRIPDRKGIELRPKVVDQKGRIGDWESDLVVSSRKGKGAVATFVERKMMYFKAVLVENQSAGEMLRATHHAFKDIPEKLLLTMTHDNGKEISKHTQITEEIGIEVYCARPYCSCDRGLNEFMNRELRRFFPKGTDFSQVTQKDIDFAVDWLNNCPRKSLNYRTPQEVYEEQLQIMRFTL